MGDKKNHTQPLASPVSLPASSLPPLREVIARYGLSARKGLGQNFILDMNITRKIVRGAALPAGMNVIEIGPGPGGLTRAILESDAASLTVIELDPRAIGIMQELQETRNKMQEENRLSLASGLLPLTIIEGDALEFNYATVPSPRAIIANLPYHVASQLLIGWLRQISEFHSITIMLQKEMAQRLVAKPRTPAYGRLSVMTQWLCDAKILFDVPPSAFVPPPKVTSSIVHLVPKKNLLLPLREGAGGGGTRHHDNLKISDEIISPHPTPPPQGGRESLLSFNQMEETVALAFSQRRKMLKGILNAAGYEGEKLLENINAPPTARAEELSVEQFVSLSQTFIPAKAGIQA